MKWYFVLLLALSLNLEAQILGEKEKFTTQDSLRGSNNAYRDWWNVLHYDIELEPLYAEKFIQGKNKLRFKVIASPKKSIMQIDLQEPMQLNQAVLNGRTISNIERNGNVYFLTLDKKLPMNSENELVLEFSGHPHIAIHPPWDGGWIFTKDKKGRPWMSMSCQGLGASVWFPNKDYQGDEPDEGARLKLIVPQEMKGVANGRLVAQEKLGEKMAFQWEVKNPINNYNIAPNIGHYEEIKDVYQGEKGTLDLTYHVLDYQVEKAKKQFAQTRTMLKSFEHWFGSYPFYEDGFQLVEAPHLGMEHQSAVAYGNGFENGYLGKDMSGTGWGLKWDFILIHESGHEWFGNNITTNDLADMWVHEGFTTYSEAIYTEDLFGLEAGRDYVIGLRGRILNDVPMIGPYGVNQSGSSDVYFKGANMIHTLRQWINDDALFRALLRGMNADFHHQTVDTKEIEDYWRENTKLNLKPFFDQYLRTVQMPVLEYQFEGNQIKYRWNQVVEGFDMPVKLANSSIWLYPTAAWKIEILEDIDENNFKVDRNFYIQTKKIL